MIKTASGNPALILFDDILNTNKIDYRETADDVVEQRRIAAFDSSRLVRTRTTHVCIDSRKRDTTLYPDVNKFRVSFARPFKLVKRIAISSTEFPNSQNVIREHGTARNNRLVWRLKDAYLGTDTTTDDPAETQVYACDIPANSYTGAELAVMIATQMSRIYDYTRLQYQNVFSTFNSINNVLEIIGRETYVISRGAFGLTRRRLNLVDVPSDSTPQPRGDILLPYISASLTSTTGRTPEIGDLIVSHARISSPFDDVVGDYTPRISVLQFNLFNYTNSDWNTDFIACDAFRYGDFTTITNTTTGISVQALTAGATKAMRIECWGAGGGGSNATDGQGLAGGYAKRYLYSDIDAWIDTGESLIIQNGDLGYYDTVPGSPYAMPGGMLIDGYGAGGGGDGTFVQWFVGPVERISLVVAGGGSGASIIRSLDRINLSVGVGMYQANGTTGFRNYNDTDAGIQYGVLFPTIVGDGALGATPYMPSGGGGFTGGQAGITGCFLHDRGGSGGCYGDNVALSHSSAVIGQTARADPLFSGGGSGAANGVAGMTAITVAGTTVACIGLNARIHGDFDPFGNADTGTYSEAHADGQQNLGWYRRMKMLWSEPNTLAPIIDVPETDTNYLYRHANAINVEKSATGAAIYPYYQGMSGYLTHLLGPADIIIEHNAFDTPLKTGDAVFISGLTNLAVCHEKGFLVRTFDDVGIRNFLDSKLALGSFPLYWNLYTQNIAQNYSGRVGTTGTASVITGTTFASWEEFSRTHFFISLENTGRAGASGQTLDSNTWTYADIPRFYDSDPAYRFDSDPAAELEVRRNQQLDLSADKFAYLTIASYGSMFNTNAQGTNVARSAAVDWQRDTFAKIQLNATTGTPVFNTSISVPKVFLDAPLRSLDHLDIAIRDEAGNLYDFFGADWSFTLEIVEYVDVSSTDEHFSSRRGLTETIQVI
jgi:hypothetical protein